MIDKTLQHLIHEQLTSAREISELAGVSSSTVYRWIAGESQPDFNSIRLLLRHLSDPQAQQALLAAFAAGTPWQFVHHDDPLDVNNDGQLNTDDALDAAIAVMQTSARSLQQVREAARDHQLTGDETVRAVSALNHTISRCALTQRILVELSERHQRRDLKLAR
ncbi:MAG: helix-turn-helix domain-containing protein [Phycisphaeraceae bacterium]